MKKHILAVSLFVLAGATSPRMASADATANVTNIIGRHDPLTANVLSDFGGQFRLPPHPRLLADAEDFSALKERLETTELGRRGRAALMKAADELLSSPLPRYKKDESGRRILSISRAMVGGIGKLAMAYRLTGRGAYAAKAIALARAAAGFSDWNPSHFLDTAEMTFAEALCYDWLYDALSDGDRAAISQAILSKGLLDGKGCLAAGGWTRGHNNWCQVCHGGLVAGAVATYERNPGISRQVIDRAVECLPLPMSVFAPDGGFPEGAGGYWQYAMEYNVLAIWAIEKLDGTDHGLCSLPGFAAEVDFLGACTGPTGVVFNFSDAGGAREPKLSPTYAQGWLARRFNRPDASLSLGFDVRDRLFPLQLLVLEEQPRAPAVRSPLARVIRGENPIATMRTDWNDSEAWYAGLKGGRVSCSHGHMDIGSFVLDAKGVRWVHDLGCEHYARVEAAKVDLWRMTQNSPRWDLPERFDIIKASKVVTVEFKAYGSQRYGEENRQCRAGRGDESDSQGIRRDADVGSRDLNVDAALLEVKG